MRTPNHSLLITDKVSDMPLTGVGKLETMDAQAYVAYCYQGILVGNKGCQGDRKAGKPLSLLGK